MVSSLLLASIDLVTDRDLDRDRDLFSNQFSD